MTLVRTGRHAQFVSARGNYGNASPLWMLERVSVARSRRSLVLPSERDRSAPIGRLANQAVTDVRKVLPLLAEPEYYQTAKNGYARGGMPVAFVGRVRNYYDILLRSESAQKPQLQAAVSMR